MKDLNKIKSNNKNNHPRRNLAKRRFPEVGKAVIY